MDKMAADVGGGVCSTCGRNFSSFDKFWNHLHFDGRDNVYRRNDRQIVDDAGNEGDGCNGNSIFVVNRAPAEGAEEQEDEPSGEGAMEQQELYSSSVAFQTPSSTSVHQVLF